MRIVSLEAAHEGDPKAAGQVRVFSISLLTAPPAWIAEDVDVGRPDRQAFIPLGVSARFAYSFVILRARLRGDCFGNLLMQLWIPGGRERDCLWKDRGNAIASNPVERLVPPVI